MGGGAREKRGLGNTGKIGKKDEIDHWQEGFSTIPQDWVVKPGLNEIFCI